MSQQSLVAMILRGLPCTEGSPAKQLDTKVATTADLSWLPAAGPTLRSEIAARAVRYYTDQDWDPRSLIASLRSTFRRRCEPALLALLNEAFTLAMSRNCHLRFVLYAFYRLTGSHYPADLLHPRHIVAYAAALDDLMLIRPRPTANAWQSLERDVRALIADRALPDELEVYLQLIVAEAKAFPQDTQIDLDLFGDLTTAFRQLRAHALAPADWQLISQSIEHQRDRGQSALYLLRAFNDLGSSDLSTSGGASHLIGLYHTALAKFTSEATPAEVVLFRRHLDPLVQSVGNSEVVSVLAAGARLLAREGRIKELSTLSSLCDRIHDWTTRPQLLRNIVRAVDDGQMTSSQQLIEALHQVGTHGALEQFSVSQGASLISALGAFYEFTNHRADEVLTVARAEQKYLEWQQVARQRELLRAAPMRSITRSSTPEPPANRSSPLTINQEDLRTTLRLQDRFFGFSALRYAAQRTPARGAAELARFGNDVGRVSYLNAREVTGFPGRGFFLRELKLHKIFVTDPSDSAGDNPYAMYHSAWPALAAEFADLELAEFLLARGMIVISCRTLAKYNLTFPDGHQQQMSLAIFNDHFRNLLSCEAALIPTAMLRARLGQCFVGFDDFTGFQPKRPDANLTIASIQSLFTDKRYAKHVLPVGNPQRLRTGFPEWHDSTNLQMDAALWERFTASVEVFNQRLKAWQSRGHNYHVSDRGLAEQHALRNLTVDLANYAASLARDDRDRLYQVFTRMRKAERPIWQLIDQHLNLLDLLLISLAAWHKGHTQGEIVSREDDGEQQEFDWAPSLGTADKLFFGEDEEVFWNQNAIRMLALAYEWHSQRRRGILDRNQYPILTVTDALKLGSVDPPQCWLDTFDMTAHIHGQEIPLTLHAMTVDDEQFWHTQFMPQAADIPGKLCDLRFYPRDSLGLEDRGRS